MSLLSDYGPHPPQGQAFDAAIVLGAQARPDGTPSPAMERRVRLGVELLRAGRTRFLILSGGPTRSGRPEAVVMADLALRLGADPARLILEPQAMTTLGNAYYCQPILAMRNFHHLALVTCGFHLPRARLIFARLGMKTTGFAARPEQIGREWRLAQLREAFAFIKTLWKLAQGQYLP